MKTGSDVIRLIWVYTVCLGMSDPFFFRLLRQNSIIEPAQDKTYIKNCVTSKDSDQPVRPSSMARVLVYLSFDSLEAVEGICDQRRLWSDCADEQADMSSLVARLIVGVVRWLNSYLQFEAHLGSTAMSMRIMKTRHPTPFHHLAFTLYSF